MTNLIAGTIGCCIGLWLAHLCGATIYPGTFVFVALVMAWLSWKRKWL